MYVESESNTRGDRMADSARTMGVTVTMGAMTTMGAGTMLWVRLEHRFLKLRLSCLPVLSLIHI